MQFNKIIWQLIACFVTWELVYAYPQERLTTDRQINNERHRLSSETDIDMKLLPVEEIKHLYRNQRTLNRLRRALDELDFEQSAADDLDLAEINVFRPLFRYRAEAARQVKRQPQFR